MIKVLVLGCTGMLGDTISRFFARREHIFEMTLSYRGDLSFVSSGFFAFNGKFVHFDAVTDSCDKLPKVDYVINCIGAITQKKPTLETFDAVNAKFPHRLAAWCESQGAKLIHVSTDCVFSGTKTEGYTELDVPDATDAYGASKLRGEPAHAMCLRTSVIGPELMTHFGLMEWARSMRGQKINGYTNHTWNGITSFEYARVCAQIIMDGLYEQGVHHVFSTPVTKYDLLQKINASLILGLDIVPCETVETINRTLSTVKPLCGKLNINDIDALVAALY